MDGFLRQEKPMAIERARRKARKQALEEAAKVAERELREVPAEKLSALDRLEIEIMEAQDAVNRGKKRPIDCGYAHGLGRAQFLLKEHVEALSKLVAAQAALIEVQEALLAERPKEG